MNLAIFDLDHTLIGCDTECSWIEYMYECKLLDDRFLTKRDELFCQYQEGVVDTEEFIRFQLSSIHRLSYNEIKLLYPRFLKEYILPKVYPKASELVNQHKQRGDELLLISASNSLLITPIAHTFGIHEVIGINPQMDENGQFNGKVDGIASFKEGKVIRLNEWLKNREQSLNDFNKSYFYSDSVNDLPLLSLVTHPHAVNPDNTLGEIALQNQWTVLNLA